VDLYRVHQRELHLLDTTLNLLNGINELANLGVQLLNAVESRKEGIRAAGDLLEEIDLLCNKS
jgi:hypothetical protein